MTLLTSQVLFSVLFLAVLAITVSRSLPQSQEPRFVQPRQAPQIQDRSDPYGNPQPSYGGHPKGRVGPVYTFVKTDPKVEDP